MNANMLSESVIISSVNDPRNVMFQGKILKFYKNNDMNRLVLQFDVFLNHIHPFHINSLDFYILELNLVLHHLKSIHPCTDIYYCYSCIHYFKYSFVTNIKKILSHKKVYEVSSSLFQGLVFATTDFDHNIKTLKS